MSQYSVGGYQIAVMARSGKTLLVEGKDDRLVVQRVLLEPVLGGPIGRKVRVDSTELVRDDVVQGKGARDKVLYLADRLRFLEGKVKGLVDREWEFFCTETYIERPEHDFGGNVFITRGHSIENYFFSPDICCDFLKEKHASTISPELLDQVEESFSRIVKFAFSYSVACRRLGLIDRLDNFISPRHLIWDVDFSCDEQFALDLRRRGVSDQLAVSLVSLIKEISVDIETLRVSELCGRWNAHGHLGGDAVWACIGRIAASHGASPAEADQICHGYRDDRLKASAHVFARNLNEEAVPFDSIIRWAHS